MKRTLHAAAVARWDVVSPEIHRITLPNGFNVGLQIEPASAAKNAETAKKPKCNHSNS